LEDRSRVTAISKSAEREAAYRSALLAAIAHVEQDSFEARGAVYDRLWQNLLNQLHAAQAYSESDIAAERAIFLRAVQAIEFGSNPRHEEESLQQASPGPAEPSPSVTRTRQPFRRIATAFKGPLAALCVALLIVGVASVLIARAPAVPDGNQGPFDSWRSQLARALQSARELTNLHRTTDRAERAVLYEEDLGNAAGTAHVGRVVWRARADGSAAAQGSGQTLFMQVEIPQRDLRLTLSLQRVTDENSAMSHFVEFRFSKTDRTPTDAVANVVGILMKNDERARGIELAGEVAMVQAGVFLMGLSGASVDVSRNMMLLRDKPWLDIPIVLKDRSRNILAIEKGESGQNAVNEVLASWGQS
jgi:hypothetical protein